MKLDHRDNNDDCNSNNINKRDSYQARRTDMRTVSIGDAISSPKSRRGFLPFSAALIFFLLFVASRSSCLLPLKENLTQRRELQETPLPVHSLSYPHIHPTDFLGANSVILIIGAAGLLGSELTMALHRTYSPKKLLLVDSLVSPSLSEDSNEYSSIEYKRQRIFHVMQTVGNTARFFKCDVRPVIPEFFEVGEVPVLDNIFKQHADITHVVHLANIRDPNRAVPRESEDVKAGMMEAILEQLKKLGDQRSGQQLPHLTFGSSYEVYNNKSGPFSEDDIIEAPMSLFGASKLMDEILASTYYNVHGIYSVGLRFFELYGPWGNDSKISEMAEKAISISMNSKIGGSGGFDQNLQQILGAEKHIDIGKDYIYIDDAVDAVMTAMQYRPPIPTNTYGKVHQNNSPPPALFNVGTGKTYSLQEIAGYMLQLTSKTPYQKTAEPSLTLQASTKRAQSYLGLRPEISLEQGLKKLLAWHYDRSIPFGDSNFKESSTSNTQEPQGISECNPFDKECMNGSAVFPCLSDCAHSKTCIPTFYDTVAPLAKKITNGCSSVLYTVALGEDIERIPSATVSVSPKSRPNVPSNSNHARCNLAFVSEKSKLYQSLLLEEDQNQPSYQHGFWTLLPVSGCTPIDPREKYLPKLSPRNFFSSTVKYAVYADPNVLFYNLPSLLKEMEEIVPYGGEIVMMTSSAELSLGSTSRRRYDTEREQTNSSIQDRAYNMVHLAFEGKMRKGKINSSWLIHNLRGGMGEESRLFRCDVFSEIILWDVMKDDAAINFVAETHDLWARKTLNWNDEEPWWTGENNNNLPISHQLGPYRSGDYVKGGKNQEEVHSHRTDSNFVGNPIRWMGIISSTPTKYFVKLLSAESDHLVYLDQ